MKRTLAITGALLILMAVIVTIITLLTPGVKSAFLKDVSGSIDIVHGSNTWAGHDGIDVSQNDIIQTSLSGEATLVIHESVFVHIRPESRLALITTKKSGILIELMSGAADIKTTGLNSAELITVQTSGLEASAQEAHFSISPSTIEVLQGMVEAFADGQWFELHEQEQLQLSSLGTMVIPFDEEQKQQSKQRAQEALKDIRDIREQEIEKNRQTIEVLKALTDTDEQNMRIFIEQIDRGIINPEDAFEQSPIKTESLRRLVELSKEIQAQEEFIASLDQQ